MKKLILILTIVFFMGNNKIIMSQTPEDNLSKYWYYRYRVWNQFLMAETYLDNAGDIEDGVFHLATSRNPAMNKLRFGDEPEKLAYYIMVLATEYRLLKESGQDYMPVFKKLKCVLLKLKSGKQIRQ